MERGRCSVSTAGREVTVPGKGLKHDQGKPMWGLLPWLELAAVVDVLTFGAQKYLPHNWKKVTDGERRYFDAALRHISAIGAGEYNDKETGFAHYAHAICSLIFAFWHSRNGRARVRRNGPQRTAANIAQARS